MLTIYMVNSCDQVLMKFANRIIHHACSGTKVQEDIVEAFRECWKEFSQIENPVPGKEGEVVYVQSF